MDKALVSSIISLASREGYYLPLIKAKIFTKLFTSYPIKAIRDVIKSRQDGTWGKDFIVNGKKVKVLRSPDIRHGIINFESAAYRYIEEKDLAKHRLIDD